jgi:hypothetical protein
MLAVEGPRHSESTMSVSFSTAGVDVEGAVFHRRHDQLAPFVQRGAGHVLLPGADGNLIDTALRSLAGAAETAGQAGQVLQFEGHVFKDVRRPGAFLDPAQETAALFVAAAVLDQRGQHRREAWR